MEKVKLFMIHYAGGNLHSFRFLYPYLKAFHIIPVELPGRGSRIEETLIQNFSEATEEVFLEIKSKTNLGEEFYIYGHSMGALLSLSVSNLLTKNGKEPKSIILSGSAGPNLVNTDKFENSNQGIKLTLKELGGTDNEILENEEFLLFFTPIIRADFSIVKDSIDYPFEPIKIPIFLAIGENESFDKQKCKENWQQFSRKQFTFHTFPGGHFFIKDNPALFCNAIVKHINNLSEIADTSKR